MIAQFPQHDVRRLFAAHIANLNRARSLRRKFNDLVGAL